MMNASDLDRRIAIERFTETRNAFNEIVQSWEPLATVSAKRHDVSDAERFAAGQIGAELRSRFIIRDVGAASTVTPVDRLSHDDNIWNVNGIKQTRDGRDRFLEITATAAL
ncbi:phage head closure protein [Aurantimonas marina]|uniref:phage head closure protein n=1 Tax=Aurantimonas marina TaxID=2780508 RepID=UPI0019D16BC4|nr:phage head closure protein [Aurantimonas marina]